jgi:hypothetical protein
MPDADTETMFDVMDYLEWAILSGLDLKFEITDDDYKWIHASVNSYVWRDHLAHEDLWILPSYEFFQQLNEYINVLFWGDLRT